MSGRLQSLSSLRMRCRCLLLLLPLCVGCCKVVADEFSPALLQIDERDGGWVDVVWKVPTKGNRVLALQPVLPGFLQALGEGTGRRVPGAWLQTNSYRTGGRALTGETVSVEGLEGLPTDVLVRISLADGSTHSTLLRGGAGSFTIPERAGSAQVAASYWRMGTVHILEGFDHLLFLFALLLIIDGLVPLVKTVTAFTVAHSLTLALATLELVHVPSSPTEAVISLSILLLAVEVVRKFAGEQTLTERYPWVVAFTFGLVHGLGFAGALSEIGVPQHDVPLALLMFNVGVETGQLMFVIGVSLLLAALRHLHAPVAQGTIRLAPYAIGGLAAFWTIERLVNTFSSV